MGWGGVGGMAGGPAAMPGAGEVPLTGCEAAYEVLGELGRGAGGEVHKVRQLASGRVLALKRQSAAAQGREGGLGLALEEARVLSRLQHPNVIRYYDSFVDWQGRLCLVTSFCPGGDLAGEVRKAREAGRPIPEAQVVAWLAQLAAALEYLHAKHVMHRDLKPQNVFIGRGGVLRVGDFGVAKAMDATDDLAQTCTGTPFYLAPEVCRNKGYGFKSDCWSLGCILYELLALEPAFAADSLMSVVYKIAKGKVKALPEGRCSADLESTVHQLLARQPDQRPGPREVRKAPWLQARLAEIEPCQLESFGRGGGDGSVSLVGTGAVEAAMARVRETEMEVERRRDEEREKRKGSSLKRHQNLGKLQVLGAGAGAGAGGTVGSVKVPGTSPAKNGQKTEGWYPPADLQSSQLKRRTPTGGAVTPRKSSPSTISGAARASPGGRALTASDKRASRAGPRASPGARSGAGPPTSRSKAAAEAAAGDRERVLAWTPGAELAQASAQKGQAGKAGGGNGKKCKPTSRRGLCSCFGGVGEAAVAPATGPRGGRLAPRSGGQANRIRSEATTSGKRESRARTQSATAVKPSPRKKAGALERKSSARRPQPAVAGGGKSPRPGAAGGSSSPRRAAA